MNLRWRTLTVAAAGAAALPVALALLSSGSCSLAELYSGADAGSDGPAPVPLDCPDGMVGVPPDAAGFCVDALEVTNLEYARFLAGLEAGAPAQPAECHWNKSFEPLASMDAGDDLPVLGIDWCDARAFCAWAGKRLCGSVDGGALLTSGLDVENDAWYVACSGRDRLTYPYGAGNAFDEAACDTCDPDAGCDVDAARPIAVGSRPTCQGGYPGLFDLSGNAWEWQDACGDGGVEPDASDHGMPIVDPRYDTCYRRGGGFLSAQKCTRCQAAGCPGAASHRGNRSRDMGVRCCFVPPDAP